MKRLRRWLQDQRLYKKIMYIILGAWVLVVSVCIGMWQIVYGAFNELLYDKTEQIFTSLTGQVENVMDELNMLTLSMIGDNLLQECLIVVRDNPYLSQHWREGRQTLTEQVLNYLANCDEFVTFSIFRGAQAVYGETQYDNLNELHQMAQNVKGDVVITVSDDKVLLVRQIRQINNLKFTDLGTMIGELDIRHILHNSKKMYQRSGITLNMSVFIEGTCVYHDDESILPLDKDGWQIVEDNFVVQCTTKSGWKYLFYIPYKEILDSIRIVFWVMSVAGFAVISMILVICNLILKKIFRQLDELVLKFEAYSEGGLPTDKDIQEYQDRKDEIGYLNRQFIEMAYKHKVLEEENYSRILLQKEAQYMLLKQQIRPHFIFNTLSQITWMAYQHNDIEIAELSNALSKLIRSSMCFDDKAITAREELKLVEDYMHIQLVRYGKRIDFQMSVPSYMEEVLIPQMIIQPIVENSISHALENMLDQCAIRVTGRVENNKAIFIVEDNGPGIEEDILEKLATNGVKPKGNGIGLLNVQQRIQILFSEEYGLSFHRIGECTQVWITVPYNKTRGTSEAFTKKIKGVQSNVK